MIGMMITFRLTSQLITTQVESVSISLSTKKLVIMKFLKKMNGLSAVEGEYAKTKQRSWQSLGHPITININMSISKYFEFEDHKAIISSLKIMNVALGTSKKADMSIVKAAEKNSVTHPSLLLSDCLLKTTIFLEKEKVHPMNNLFFHEYFKNPKTQFYFKIVKSSDKSFFNGTQTYLTQPSTPFEVKLNRQLPLESVVSKKFKPGKKKVHTSTLFEGPLSSHLVNAVSTLNEDPFASLRIRSFFLGHCYALVTRLCSFIGHLDTLVPVVN
ncbi:hypothetical protein EDC94DRAFT_580089 [Helicostylum pulchrum]|nr:hypothetical protein EDC94DRAFT_580089 [Helicostylum pulchrum]